MPFLPDNSGGSNSTKWGGISGTLSDQTDLQTDLNAKIDHTEKGSAGGVAELNSVGKVPTIQIDIATPADVENSILDKILEASIVTNDVNLSGNSKRKIPSEFATKGYVDSKISSVYRPVGSWNASIGSFPSGGVTLGDTYYVDTAGTVDSVIFHIGDKLSARVDNPSSSTFSGNWSKFDNNDDVSQVFGRTGLVVSQYGDYAATQISYNAIGDISSTNVQDAIGELDNEKLSKNLLGKGELFIGNVSGVAEPLPSGLNGLVLISDSSYASGAYWGSQVNGVGHITYPTGFQVSGGSSSSKDLYINETCTIDQNLSKNSDVSFYTIKGSTSSWFGLGTGSSVPSNISAGSLSSLDFSVLGGGEFQFMTTNAGGEAAAFFQNGNTSGFCNPGDGQALWYYDEDSPSSPVWYITTSGSIQTYSDINRKRNVESINKNNTYEEFRKIDFVSFNWIKDEKMQRLEKKLSKTTDKKEIKYINNCLKSHKSKDLGVIAQQVEKDVKLDNIIIKDLCDDYRFDYKNLSIYAFSVIQELQSIVEKLREDIDKLRK